MAEGIPTSAQAVVIGGGVVGCATAYHLAKAGWRDVVLLEKGHLTSGTTWHAAGAVAQYRSNLNVMRLIAYAVELYPRLETETGQATGWRQSGGIRLASHPDRRREYERTITAARSFGLEMHLISPEEAKGLFPLLSVEGVDCALYVPSDGSVGPSDVTMALAKGARQRGARILENTAVVGFESERGAICAVITEKGRIACDKVALCAGLWSRELGKLAGVSVPLWPCHHCYMVSEPIAGLSPDVPVARDPDLHHYFREWSGGLMIGQYELDPLPSPRTPSRSDPEFNLEPENLEHFVPRFLPSRLTTSRRSICAAFRLSTAPMRRCACARSRARVATTPSITRTRRWRPGGLCAAAPSTSGSRRRAPASVPRPAGSGPTGSPPKGRSPSISPPLAGPTGFPPWPRNAGRCASAPGCSMPPLSPSSS